MNNNLNIELPGSSWSPNEVNVSYFTPSGENKSMRYMREPMLIDTGRIMSEETWEALRIQESAFWRGSGSPTLGYTDTCLREESGQLAMMWETVFDCMTHDGTIDELENSPHFSSEEARRKAILARVAARMARALAVITFGADILIR